MEILYKYSTCSDIDENELLIIGLSIIIIYLISLISLLISLLTYFILPNFKKNKALRLIGYLLASNAISSVINIIPGTFTATKSGWRIIFTLIKLFSFNVGINLTLIFSLNLYCDVYRKKSLLESEKLIIIISIGIAGLLALILTVAFLLNYDVSIIIEFIYVIPVMTATIGLYVKVIVGFNKISYPGAIQCMKDLAIYPIVSIVMMILFCSQHILFIRQKCWSDYYWIVYGIRAFQGFINAMIYGFNTTVRAEISKKFCKRQEINFPLYNDHTQDPLL